MSDETKSRAFAPALAVAFVVVVLIAGDILLGDRAYGEYTTLAALPTRGVDVVARLHQKRKFVV